MKIAVGFSSCVYTLMCDKILWVRDVYIENRRTRKRKGTNSIYERRNQKALIRLEVSPKRYAVAFPTLRRKGGCLLSKSAEL